MLVIKVGASKGIFRVGWRERQNLDLGIDPCGLAFQRSSLLVESKEQAGV